MPYACRRAPCAIAILLIIAVRASAQTATITDGSATALVTEPPHLGHRPFWGCGFPFGQCPPSFRLPQSNASAFVMFSHSRSNLTPTDAAASPIETPENSTGIRVTFCSAGGSATDG